jgi:hypothetical protein
MILSISESQTAKITDVSHWHLAKIALLMIYFHSNIPLLSPPEPRTSALREFALYLLWHVLCFALQSVLMLQTPKLDYKCLNGRVPLPVLSS